MALLTRPLPQFTANIRRSIRPKDAAQPWAESETSVFGAFDGRSKAGPAPARPPGGGAGDPCHFTGLEEVESGLVWLQQTL